MNKLTYITYQSFPAETANSLQTISNIKYFVKNNISISLYFPLRESKSNSDLRILQEKYKISENFMVHGIKHYLPFGRVKIFKKTIFHFSHIIWSGWVVYRYFKNRNDNDIFFTRSEWVLYFLSKKECTVVFECHQTSKSRNFILKKLALKKNILFIFLNNALENFYKIPKERSLVLHNGVDLEFFNPIQDEKENKIIFVGSLSRFGKNRNLKFLIDCYEKSEILKKFSLSIVGGPEDEALELSKDIEKRGLSDIISVLGQLSRKESLKEVTKSKIGILINSSDNNHSYLYTSPLKYFEYLYGGLNIVAIDFPAHRELPMFERINYFEENNIDDFIVAIENSLKIPPNLKQDYKSISLDTRVKKIIRFIEEARPEGLEPPTL